MQHSGLFRAAKSGKGQKEMEAGRWKLRWELGVSEQQLQIMSGKASVYLDNNSLEAS